MLKKIKGICKIYGWFCVAYWAIVATAARAKAIRACYDEEKPDLIYSMMNLFRDSLIEIRDYIKDFCLPG